jgi:4'-phosphopantetheinyl transferase
MKVLHWPAAGAAPIWHDGLLALATRVPAGGKRETARADIRAALCEAAGLLTDTGPERIEVAGAPGVRPRLLIDGEDCGIGVAISHAETLSVAVLRRDGLVGVDVMQIVLPSDWARVAQDYLGMAVSVRLAALADTERPLAFCQAWAAREAALKLRGEGLREWAVGDLDGARFIELELRDGLVGVVAV